MPGSHALQIFGIALVGAYAENGRKLLLNFARVPAVLLPAKLTRTATANRSGDWVGFCGRPVFHADPNHEGGADHGTRDIKDTIYRKLLDQLEASKIGIASAITEVTGFPALTVQPRAVP